MGRNSQIWPLQVAIVAAIEADSGLRALLAGDMIYNIQPPQGTPFPYLTLGFAQEVDDNLFGRPGTLAGQIIDGWTRKTTVTDGLSQELGGKQLADIYSRVRYVLHQQPLSVDGFAVVLGNVSLLSTMEDPDGLTLHASMRYDVTSREAA